MWSYVIHVWCDSHSTCGDLVRDYYIRFQLFALSNPSVPTLFFKDPQRCGLHNTAGSSDGQVIWAARLSSSSKIRENPLFNNNKKSFLLKHVCEINKRGLLSWQTVEERISREEEWQRGVVRVTLTSLKSETLKLCNIWRWFGVLRVWNGRDAFLAVLSFFLVPFLILSEDSFNYPIFIDQYLD